MREAEALRALAGGSETCQLKAVAAVRPALAGQCADLLRSLEAHSPFDSVRLAARERIAFLSNPGTGRLKREESHTPSAAAPGRVPGSDGRLVSFYRDSDDAKGKATKH
jgi:hypothetical protein